MAIRRPLCVWLGLAAATLLVSCASLFGIRQHRTEEWESACFDHGNKADCIDLDRRYEAAEKAESATAADLALLKQKRCRMRQKYCSLDGNFAACTQDLERQCSLSPAQAHKEAQQLLFAGCQERRWEACIGFIFELRDHHPVTDPTVIERIQIAEEISCEVRVSKDCDVAIRRHLRNGNLKQAEELARQFNCRTETKVCDAEVGALFRSILNNTFYKHTDDEKRNLQQLVATYMTRGCELGEAGACILLLRDADADARAERAALAATGLLRLCEKGDAAICLEAANLLATEPSVRDTARAETLIRSVCPSSRCRLESALRIFSGGAQQSAVQLIRPGCDAGDDQQCRFLCGMLVRLEKPEPQQRDETVKSCSNACDRGVGEACWDLSHVFAIGQLVRKDAKRARALLLRACDKGSQNACWEIKGPQYSSGDRASLGGLGHALGQMAKVIGGWAIAPLMLPLCALGVKQNPACPVNWLK